MQFTVLGLANRAGEGYLTSNQRVTVYYALQVFVIHGYLLYCLYFRFCTGKRLRDAIARGVSALFFICAAWMLFAGTDSLLNVIASMASALCVGGIGGATHNRMSRETVTGTKIARSMGMGSAAAVVLQYLLQIQWGITPLLPVFMLAALILLLLLLSQQGTEAVQAVIKKQDASPPGRLVFAVLIAATYILFACFYT